tara:strand:+ start:542 stop:802 length:261 start_codon:yes stop_codon:yes gene_type:complete
MFFPLSFLPPDKAEEVFKFLNEAREKEKKRQEAEEEKKRLELEKERLELERKKKQEEYNKLFKNPPTSITGMIGYSYLIKSMNPNN